MNYIYIKTHNITKKKYIGIHDDTNTTVEDYQGSGKYWYNHIRKHGYDVTTEILAEHEDRDAALEIEDYYIVLSGALTWNKAEFCNLTRGGKGNIPGITMKMKLGEGYVDPRKGKKWEEIYKNSGREILRNYKHKDFDPDRIDPRQNKTWEEIYGQTESEIKRIKQSIEKSINLTGKKYKPRKTIDNKKGRTLINIYGYNKYANPPKPFTIKFTYPDNKIEVRLFEHEQDFFEKTKLETTTLFRLKTDKRKVIKKIQSTTKHIYPKGTILEIID